MKTIAPSVATLSLIPMISLISLSSGCADQLQSADELYVPAPGATGQPSTPMAGTTSPAPSSSATPAVPSAPPAITPPSTPPVVTPPPGTPAVTLPSLVALYAQVDSRGDCIMSRTDGEGAPSYRSFGTQYFILESAPQGIPSLPLYRCYDANRTHYQTTRADCEGVVGSTLESVLGYVLDGSQGPQYGGREIVRCISPAGNAILTTLHPQDCTDNGLLIQLSVGFAFAPL